MVGGDEATFEQVKPYLLDIAPKAANYVGGNGLAVTMKIATNLSLAVQMLAFSEGLLLAEKSGIKREVADEGEGYFVAIAARSSSCRDRK